MSTPLIPLCCVIIRRAPLPLLSPINLLRKGLPFTPFYAPPDRALFSPTRNSPPRGPPNFPKSLLPKGGALFLVTPFNGGFLSNSFYPKAQGVKPIFCAQKNLGIYYPSGNISPPLIPEPWEYTNLE